MGRHERRRDVREFRQQVHHDHVVTHLVEVSRCAACMILPTGTPHRTFLEQTGAAGVAARHVSCFVPTDPVSPMLLGSSWTVRCGAATWDMSHFSILLGPGAEFSLICGATLLAIHIDKGLQCTQ